MLYFFPDFCSESRNWVDEEGKAPATGLGLGHQLREPSSEESWPQKALRDAPTVSWAAWVLPGPAARGPLCPGMAVSGQFSCGDQYSGSSSFERSIHEIAYDCHAGLSLKI